MDYKNYKSKVAMHLNFYKYISLWVLCVSVFFTPAHTAFAAADNEQLPITRGEIIHDVARVTFEWAKPVDFTLKVKKLECFQRLMCYNI